MAYEIMEENTKTGGHYAAESLVCSIPATTGWHEFDFSWPVPISILSAEWINDSAFSGDEAQMIVAPDTIIGTITVDVSASASTIDVSQTVIDNTAVGYWVLLDDGTNADDCGRVTSVDEDNLKITVEIPTTNSFLASTPTYVKQTIKMVPSLKLSSSGRHQLGESKIGGSHLPANTTVRVRYNNSDGLAKEFKVIIEYLY